MIKSAIEYATLVNTDFESARRVEANESVWLSILNKMPYLKEEVALNKILPDTILSLLSKDKDSQIRFSIAMKRRLSYEVFERLAFDDNESVRLAIANNPKVPITILEKMKTDSWNKITKIVNNRLSEYDHLL